jgi:hypothetical protein
MLVFAVMVAVLPRRTVFGHRTANNRTRQLERTATMNSTTKMASLVVGLLLSCGVLTVARADIPTGYTLEPGTVLSTHTPETDVCPISEWHLWIGPHDTVHGTIAEDGTNNALRVSGTYDSHGTFHLTGGELGGTDRAATVDAQVQSDGSMIFRMTNIDDPSQCNNRTVYLLWFRNGNDFGPPPVGGR